METGEIIMWVLIALFGVWLVRREWLRAGWKAQGRCYQCGRSLGPGWKQITLLMRYSVQYVDICGRCVRRRQIWKWVMWSAVLAFGALIGAYQVYG